LSALNVQYCEICNCVVVVDGILVVVIPVDFPFPYSLDDFVRHGFCPACALAFSNA
jgi:hypothetical protein